MVRMQNLQVCGIETASRPELLSTIVDGLNILLSNSVLYGSELEVLDAAVKLSIIHIALVSSLQQNS